MLEYIGTESRGLVYYVTRFALSLYISIYMYVCVFRLDLLDSFVGKFGLYTIVLLECLAVTWIYQGFRVPSVAKNIETGDDRAISIELTSARTGDGSF